MKMSEKANVWIGAVAAITIGLSAAGCATKGYVRTQTGIVNDRVTQVQNQTTEQFGKQGTEISRVDERVTSLDNRVTTVAATANEAAGAAATANQSAAQANNAAGQAMQAANNNNTKIEAQSAQIVKLTDAQNYGLVQTASVTFATNKYELDDGAKAALMVVAQKATSQPRIVLEIEGFTDDVGPESYNLALSQKRADSVARFLLSQNVALKNVSVIGLGEETAPEQLKAEVLAIDPNADTSDIRRLARRVRVRVYAPGAQPAQTAGDGDAALASAQRQRP